MKKLYFTLFLVMCGVSGISQTPFYPSDNVSGDRFGTSLDVSGSEIIVASKSREVFPVMPGRVFLFEKVASDVIQTASFAPDNVISTDRFGESVSIDNDFIAIGAPGHNNFGSTYLYKKNAGEWEFIQQLLPSQPNPDAKFGPAVISGNYLFVSAIDDEPAGEASTLNSGFVYVYSFSGTQWEFLQQIGIAGSYHFGTEIKADENTLIITSGETSSSKIFHKYNLQAGMWNLAGSSPTYGSLEEQLGGFELAGANIYLLSRTEQTNTVSTINHATWDTTGSFNFTQGDQIYTSIAVDNDKMFIGSSNYILQMTRKFPVLYYKNLGGNWQYQSSIYGTSETDADDYFGQTLAVDGNALIIGAPNEGPFLPVGKAYYLNTDSLSTADFISFSAVLYPNPASDSFAIRTNGFAVPSQIAVYSILGKRVLSQADTSAVNVTALTNGMYFAQVYYSDGSHQTFKFIKN